MWGRGLRGWKEGGDGSSPNGNFCLLLHVSKRTQLNMKHTQYTFLPSLSADIQSFKIKL